MSNPTQAENTLPGNPGWQLTNPVKLADRDSTTYRTPILEGYASATSVQKGETIQFYVSTTSPSFSMEIFRMGWYGGAGARLMPDAAWRGLAGKYQPYAPPAAGEPAECFWEPVEFPDSGQSSLLIPGIWVSGAYVARLTESVNGKQGFIIFVVRDDSRVADLLFQCSVKTYQAYNGWGGQSFYGYNCSPQAGNFDFQTVSFNRPYMTGSDPAAGGGNGAGHFFTWDKGPGFDESTCAKPLPPSGWEYNMVRWLEREGYDVAYCTDVDTESIVYEQDGQLLYRGFLSVGHDEYWSARKRIRVERMRDAGINLAFFSGNVLYHLVALQDDSQGRPRRIMEYVDTFPNTSWLPQSLTGSRWIGGIDYNGIDMMVTSECPAWMLEGTFLQPGDVLGNRLGGYEVDGAKVNDPEQAQAPPCMKTVLRSALLPFGNGVPPAWACSNLYTSAQSCATVFVAGTMDWNWGLDDFVVAGVGPADPPRSARLSADVQQITRNILNRFRSRP